MATALLNTMASASARVNDAETTYVLLLLPATRRRGPRLDDGEHGGHERDHDEGDAPERHALGLALLDGEEGHEALQHVDGELEVADGHELAHGVGVVGAGGEVGQGSPRT